MNEREIPGVGREDLSQVGSRVVYVLPAAPAEDQVDLLDLWRAVWRRRWLVVSVALACSLIGVAYGLIATEWYRAEVLMIPADPKSGQGLSSQLGGLGALGGLAGLAGITIGGGDSAEPLALMTSRGFTQAFIEEQNLLPLLYADKWDSAAKGWKDADPSRHPDVRDAVKYFHENLRRVREDKKTHLVTLSIEWKDPRLAAEWANAMVQRLNDQMRQRSLAEAERNVDYLKKELAVADVVTLQQSIGRLLESELQKAMLARGNAEFAFRVIDKAAPPKWRARPKRAPIAVLAGVLGGAVTVFALILQHAVRRRIQVSDTRREAHAPEARA